MNMIRAFMTAGLLLAGVWSTAPAQNGDAAERERFIQQYPEALAYEGYALYQDQQHVAAAQSLERYLELAGPTADVAAVERMIEDALDQAYPRRIAYRALALEAGGDRAGAALELERYAALDPKDSAGALDVAERWFLEEYPEALLYQGHLLYSMADYDGAIAAWDRYLKLQGDPVQEMIAEAERARQGREVASRR